MVDTSLLRLRIWTIPLAVTLPRHRWDLGCACTMPESLKSERLQLLLTAVPCDPNVYIQYKVCQLEVLIEVNISFAILCELLLVLDSCCFKVGSRNLLMVRSGVLWAYCMYMYILGGSLSSWHCKWSVDVDIFWSVAYVYML